MKLIIIIASFSTAIMLASCGNDSNDNSALDSTSTLDISRKGGNNSGLSDSSSINQTDSALNRSDTPRMSN